ncbi:hypothetical protein [Arthrobacter bambusae]
MNIELQAVTKIVHMVSKCPHLEPIIGSNDKTLLTDGHIDVHSSESHSKATFDGRVHVQVKGRKLSGNMKLPRTFPITRTDLAGYLKNQGVLYFVVYINPKTGKALPAYALLNPFKLQQLIDGMASQKQVGVRIKPLPTDPERIEGIVKLALRSADEKPSMRVDSRELDFSRITVYTDGSLNLDTPVRLTRADHDYTLVLETSGGMVLSVDEELVITPAEYVGEVTTLTVSCGDFVFHHPTRRRVDKDTVELELSKGLKIQRSGTGQASTGSISLMMRETLRERFNDVGFYLACADQQVFSIDGVETAVGQAAADDQEELRGHFEYLTALMALCDHLGVDPSLVDLKPLEGKRGNQLLGLHGVMLRGEEINVEHDEPTGRILQPMGRWSLQLLVTQDTTDGKWVCRDLFHPELGLQFVMTGEDEAGETQICRVTPYEVLEREHLPFTLNLHLDNLVNAYSSIIEYPEAANFANTTVLNLVRAADLVAIRKPEFLEAALTLNSWLISKQGALPHHQINHWQIAARNGQLTQAERFEIRSLKGQASRNELDKPLLIEAACAILLGDEEEIAYCLSRLDEKQLVAFRDWPIWELHSPHTTPEDGQH